MKYLLFGTGDYYERYKKWFEKKDVLALLDNSAAKQHTYIDGIEVVSPKEGVKLPFDVVVILSFYIKEMKQQLVGLGVSDEKIYHFYDLHQLLKIEEYIEAPVVVRKEKSILLLSQDLTLGGPAIALFHAAVALKKQGYEVVYASMLEGELRKKIEEYGITVVVDKNLQIGTMVDCKWTAQFSLIICNTINFYVFLSKRNSHIPIIWWLHDSQFYYEGVDKKILQNIVRENLKVVSVGPVPQQAIQEFLPDLQVKQLLYGVADNQKIAQTIRKETKKICFVTIGFITERKAQDILVKAMEQLSKEERKQTQFLLVGQDSTLMAQNLKETTKDMEELFFVGTLDREKIHQILEKADVLICPSRQDPMPTVCVEAMMHNTPCLVSDTTGIAQYIEEKNNGLVFQNENVEELAEKMRWCVDNRDRLSEMGIQARLLYENYFSLEVFERNLLEIVDSCLF